MFPRYPLLYAAYGSRSDFILSRYFSIGPRVFKDSFDLALSKDSVPILLSKWSPRPTFLRLIAHIVGYGARKQVGGIDATGVIASMKRLSAREHIACMQRIREAMCPSKRDAV